MYAFNKPRATGNANISAFVMQSAAEGDVSGAADAGADASSLLRTHRFESIPILKKGVSYSMLLSNVSVVSLSVTLLRTSTDLVD